MDRECIIFQVIAYFVRYLSSLLLCLRRKAIWVSVGKIQHVRILGGELTRLHVSIEEEVCC